MVGECRPGPRALHEQVAAVGGVQVGVSRGADRTPLTTLGDFSEELSERRFWGAGIFVSWNRFALGFWEDR